MVVCLIGGPTVLDFRAHTIRVSSSGRVSYLDISHEEVRLTRAKVIRWKDAKERNEARNEVTVVNVDDD